MANTVYLYRSHLSGGYWLSLYEEPNELLYCEQCGDSDWLEFASDDGEEIKNYLRSQLDFLGSGGYSEKYLAEIWKECEILLGEDEEEDE